MTDSAAIDALARGQHGLITRAQLLVGSSVWEIENRLKQGVLVPVRPGVYRWPGAPQTWWQEVLAVCLSYGGTTVASHRSAARLWALEEVPAQRLEVTIQAGRSGRMPGVISHRGGLATADMTQRLRVPVTTLDRTLIDLSSVLGDATLERAVDDALRQGHTTVAKLDRRLQAMPHGGGRRLRALRLLVAARHPGHQAGENEWEDRLYRWIVGAGFARAAAAVLGSCRWGAATTRHRLCRPEGRHRIRRLGHSPPAAALRRRPGTHDRVAIGGLAGLAIHVEEHRDRGGRGGRSGLSPAFGVGRRPSRPLGVGRRPSRPLGQRGRWGRRAAAGPPGRLSAPGMLGG